MAEQFKTALTERSPSGAQPIIFNVTSNIKYLGLTEALIHAPRCANPCILYLKAADNHSALLFCVVIVWFAEEKLVAICTNIFTVSFP